MNHKKVKYYLIDNQAQLTKDVLNLLNRSYLFWEKFWLDVFVQNKADVILNSDNFFRANRVAVLVYQKKIIGLHLYTLFDLKKLATKAHTYFLFFNDDYMKKLEEMGIQHVMSMEYLSIDSEFRFSKVGLSYARVLIALALKAANMLKMDAAIGPARVDLKINKMLHEFGGVSITENVYIHNTPCDLMAVLLNTTIPHHDPMIIKISEKLWNEKI